MLAGERHQLVIADLQATIGLAEMSRFFYLTGECTHQSLFWKDGKLHIIFADSQSLQKFLFSNIFTSRIQAHTFNIYPAIFDQPRPFLQYQFTSKNQLNPQGLKEWYLKCTHPCRFRITYDHGVLCNNGFIDFLKETQFDEHAFRQAGKSMGIKVREVKEGLRCSISLWNYVKSSEEQEVKNQFMGAVQGWQISELDVSVIEGKTLIHFQCKETPTTLRLFEYFRVKLMDVDDVRLSLYYFERESSCSQVLIIRNIVNVEGLKIKQLENKLLMMLREIEDGVVYVSLKPAKQREGQVLFNAKIHMRDKQSGKNLQCGRSKIKQTMYMHFFNKELLLDIFLNKEDIVKMNKCIGNANQVTQRVKRIEDQERKKAPHFQANQYYQQFNQPRGGGYRPMQDQRREGQAYRGGNYNGGGRGGERQRGNYNGNRGQYNGHRGQYNGNRGQYNGNRGQYNGNRGKKGQYKEQQKRQQKGQDSSSFANEANKVEDKPFKMDESDFPSL